MNDEKKNLISQGSGAVPAGPDDRAMPTNGDGDRARAEWVVCEVCAAEVEAETATIVCADCSGQADSVSHATEDDRLSFRALLSLAADHLDHYRHAHGDTLRRGVTTTDLCDEIRDNLTARVTTDDIQRETRTNAGRAPCNPADATAPNGPGLLKKDCSCLAHRTLNGEACELAASSSPTPEGRPAPDDRSRGLYQKYVVRRVSDPAGKHRDCEYYVLDLMHDRFAWPALAAYEEACAAEYPDLAADLRRKMALRGTVYPAAPEERQGAPEGRPAPANEAASVSDDAISRVAEALNLDGKCALAFILTDAERRLRAALAAAEAARDEAVKRAAALAEARDAAESALTLKHNHVRELKDNLAAAESRAAGLEEALRGAADHLGRLSELKQRRVSTIREAYAHAQEIVLAVAAAHGGKGTRHG